MPEGWSDSECAGMPEDVENAIEDEPEDSDEDDED